MNLPLPPLLADVGEVIGIVIVLLIFVVPTIAQMLAKMQPPQRPPGGGPRKVAPPGSDPSVQSEIDEFLRRVSERRGRTRATPAPPRRPETPVQAELVQPPPADEPVGAGVGKQVATYLDTEEFSRRTAQLGSDVVQADADVNQRLKQDFGHDVSQLAKKPGEAAAPSVADETAAAPAAAVGAMAGLLTLLGDPEGIRQAIVLNEILQRPEDRWG
jgi:hypothetical protein